jgi:hypothetical protein
MRAITCCSWYSSHRSCGENSVSRRTAITLAFSNGRNLSPVGLRMADGTFVLSPVFRDFTRNQTVWGMISALLSFVSHLSTAFRRTILRIVLVTQLRASVVCRYDLSSIERHTNCSHVYTILMPSTGKLANVKMQLQHYISDPDNMCF